MTLRYKLRTLLIVLALGPAGCDPVYIEPFSSKMMACATYFPAF